ncbi:2-hydroxyacid dehydrogenase [Oceanobacillus halotolerans]|uniref:2-hydroxyacid dehydrogenase n=1 Tax=Oceanobacillus halotolerans TaxID=2663380 RepID=UPI0013D97CB2|nr:D-glycerate dehydrogenase [Oceanobacillus halotolerans]
MTKPIIYITRKIPVELLKPYEDRYDFRMWPESETPVPREILRREAREADGVLCMLTEKIDEAFLSENAHLQIIANMAVGYDNINVEAANRKGIWVTNTPDVLTETTADLTFALLMATARRVTEASDYIKEDRWKNWSPFLLAGSDIHHKTIGIVGMGRIGKAVAKRATGFNMSILYHNRTRKHQAEKEVGVTYVPFETLLDESDYVISLVPLTKETKHLFNEAAFQKMKESAIFINVSRGGTMDEIALYEALQSGEIKAAGLDVFEEEPISSDHPLLKLDNTVCLPHIGSSSMKTRSQMITLCLDNIDAVLQGQQPKTPVRIE